MPTTRQKNKKIIFGKIEGGEEKEHEFIPKDTFSTKNLPTGKDVIERLIYESCWRKSAADHTVADHVIAQWVYCSVYSVAKTTVAKKLNILKSEFIN